MSCRSELEKLKDQTALLLLLSKLKDLGFKTQRLKLQKLVYLSDIFGTILKKKTTSYKFRVYLYGPFTKEICSDMERLVSIDAVKADNVDCWDPNEERSFEYEIEDSKVSKLNLANKILEVNSINRSIDFAVQAAGYLNGEEIRQLVYSEPNYLEAKSKGFGEIINPEYSSATKFKEMSKIVASKDFGINLRDEEIIWLYFNYIREMQALKQGNLKEGGVFKNVKR